MDSEIEHVDDLTPEELEAETAEALPERAAMSTLNLTSLDPAGGAVEAVGDGVPEQGTADVHRPPAHAGGHGPPTDPTATAAQHSQVIADRGTQAAPEPTITEPSTVQSGDPVPDPVPGQEPVGDPPPDVGETTEPRRCLGGDDFGHPGRHGRRPGTTLANAPDSAATTAAAGGTSGRPPALTGATADPDAIADPAPTLDTAADTVGDTAATADTAGADTIADPAPTLDTAAGTVGDTAATVVTPPAPSAASSATRSTPSARRPRPRHHGGRHHGAVGATTVGDVGGVVGDTVGTVGDVVGDTLPAVDDTVGTVGGVVDDTSAPSATWSATAARRRRHRRHGRRRRQRHVGTVGDVVGDTLPAVDDTIGTVGGVVGDTLPAVDDTIGTVGGVVDDTVGPLAMRCRPSTTRSARSAAWSATRSTPLARRCPPSTTPSGPSATPLTTTVLPPASAGRAGGSRNARASARRPRRRAQVRHAVFQHRDAVDAHAPGEALVLVGIEPAIAQHVRVHHAAAENLQPVLALAEADLALVAAALDVDLERGLGEREEGRAEAHLHVVDLEEGLAELLQHPFHVAEMRALVDHEPLDLMEHRRVGLVASRCGRCGPA